VSDLADGPGHTGSADEPKHYLIGRIQEALAHDPRATELDLQVKVVGDKVFVTGQVATPERVEAIGQVVREVVPDHEVHNHVTVFGDAEPDPQTMEHLS
jgi:osmotically-inducible protein OsmY